MVFKRQVRMKIGSKILSVLLGAISLPLTFKQVLGGIFEIYSLLPTNMHCVFFVFSNNPFALR